jgi:CDP-glucose 4,6-dehydratase
VLEPLSGYLLLCEKLYAHGGVFAEEWNFGPSDGDSRPVSWIADRLAQYWGAGATWIRDERPHPHEATYLKLDWSKAHGRLGWAPRWDLNGALRHTAEWYRGYYADPAERNVRELTLADIAEMTTAMAGGAKPDSALSTVVGLPS